MHSSIDGHLGWLPNLSCQLFGHRKGTGWAPTPRLPDPPPPSPDSRWESQPLSPSTYANPASHIWLTGEDSAGVTFFWKPQPLATGWWPPCWTTARRQQLSAVQGPHTWWGGTHAAATGAAGCSEGLFPCSGEGGRANHMVQSQLQAKWKAGPNCSTEPPPALPRGFCSPKPPHSPEGSFSGCFPMEPNVYAIFPNKMRRLSEALQPPHLTLRCN